MLKNDIQGSFFKQIKDLIPGHTLVDEVADALKISNDSAYRRIRGETSLTFDEIAMLSAKYGISLDGLTHSSADMVAFKYRPLNEKSFSFESYMDSVLDDLIKIEAAEDKEMIYVANDIPFFMLLEIPEVASFKLFVWTKTILNYSMHQGKKYVLNAYFTDKIKETSVKLIELYSKIPSVEIFHAGTIDPTLNQLEYYWVSGLFTEREHALTLCDKISQLVSHMQIQAELGVKFPYGKPLPEGVLEMRKGTYKLYYNEVLHTDSTILARLGDIKIVYLTNNGHDSLRTSNPHFYKNTHRAIQNLLSKSALVSGTSEKERNRIFMRYQEKIKKLKESIK